MPHVADLYLFSMSCKNCVRDSLSSYPTISGFCNVIETATALFKMSENHPMCEMRQPPQQYAHNRLFQVHLGTSRGRVQNSDLPQGGIREPAFFNLYIFDMPATQSKKFE